MARKGKTDPEEIIRLLDRLDIPTADVDNVARLQNQLSQQFNITNPAHVAGLQNAAKDVLSQIGEQGVSRVHFEQRGRPVTRYAIKGFQGLFGKDKALKFLRGDKI